MRPAWLAGLAGAAVAVALLAGGAAPFGRLALALGLPRLAAPLLADAEWRGLALYRAGRHDAAAAAWADAPPRSAYNRGNALTRAGRYAAALEAYDAALAQVPGDAEAKANFDLVASIYAGTEVAAAAPISWFAEREGATVAAPEGQGSGRAASTGAGVTNSGPLIGLPEVASRGPLSVRRVFDDKFVRAGPRWLATLPDVPGEYLAARIAAERDRRAAAGLAPPPAEDPR